MLIFIVKYTCKEKKQVHIMEKNFDTIIAVYAEDGTRKVPFVRTVCETTDIKTPTGLLSDNYFEISKIMPTLSYINGNWSLSLSNKSDIEDLVMFSLEDNDLHNAVKDKMLYHNLNTAVAKVTRDNYNCTNLMYKYINKLDKQTYYLQLTITPIGHQLSQNTIDKITNFSETFFKSLPKERSID